MALNFKPWKKASSVIMLNVHLHQVLMLRRGPTARFMPNSLVFPGGTIDGTDSQFPIEKTNYDRHFSNQIALGFDTDFGCRVCTVRELFEESGLLPVVDENRRERMVLSANEDSHLAEWRKKIMKEPVLFPQLFSSNLKMDLASLIPWSNWLTPLKEHPTARYDTAFFLYAFNSEERPNTVHCTTEMTDALWAEPSFTIGMSSKSEISLPPPQFYELLRVRLLSSKMEGKFNQFTNKTRMSPQIFRAKDRPEIINILPGDFLYNENVDTRDFTPTQEREEARELLPPYPDDLEKPIHRLTYLSNPPLLQYHKLELHLKNFENLDHKPHLFHISL